MKNLTLTAMIALLAFHLSPLTTLAAEGDSPAVSKEQWILLDEGEPVLLSGGETSKDGKPTRVLAAILIPHPVKAVWTVVNDKEGAVEYVDGLRQAKVVEKGSNYSLIFQEMKMGILPGTFKYVVRHTVTIPNRRVDFKRESGDLKDIEGYWEFLPVDSGKGTLLFYQLHLEPGMFIPSSVVRSSLKKTLPNALRGIRGRVAEVEAAKAAKAAE